MGLTKIGRRLGPKSILVELLQYVNDELARMGDAQCDT